MISKSKIKQIKSLQQKKFRDESGLFVAEGWKVVGDLLRSGWEATEILYVGERAAADFLALLKSCHGMTTMVSEAELERMSGLQSPQGVIGVFGKRDEQSAESIDLSDYVIALDGVQDPGNVGTIIRIADWFGFGTIVCSRDTADAYSPKVVQATMGSIARVNIVRTDLLAFLQNLPTDVPVYGTLLDGESIYKERFSQRGIVVMGNEGNGISAEVRTLVNKRLLIPSFPANKATADSLNVAIATAIVCNEIRRKLL